jgi:hypothetical protein
MRITVYALTEAQKQLLYLSRALSLYSLYSCSNIVLLLHSLDKKTLLSSKTQASFVFSGRMPASCVELKE